MQSDLQAAKECLKRAQQRQKEYANSHRRETEFDVGDKVYLSTKNIKSAARALLNYGQNTQAPLRLSRR